MLESIKAFLNVGPAVMMPVFILVLGLIFRQGFSRSFRAGITIGVGFIGVFAIIGIMSNVVGPAMKAMVERFGLQLTALDMGWPTAATISWAMPTAVAIVPLCIAFNLLLIAIGQARTLNVDVWNYWNSAFTAAIMYIATHNLWLSLAAAMLFYFLLFKVGEWAAPITQDPEVFNFPGVCWVWYTTPMAVMGFFLNKLLDYVPGLNRIEADPETVRKKLGIFGEAPILGLILGGITGILAGYPVTGVLQVAVNMAAVMLLLPRMIGVLMEGLLPFADGIQEFMSKRFKGRQFYIGLDGAIAAGYVPLLATSMIVIPLAPLLAVILPGNKCLPMADLAIAWAWGVWAAAPSKGNIVRGTIIHVLFTIFVLYFATFMAPFLTGAAQMVGMELPEGVMVTALSTAGLMWPILFLIPALYFAGASDIFGYSPGAMMAFAVVWTVIYLLMWWYVRKEPARVAATPRSELAALRVGGTTHV
ncbi:MAG: PTS transporter subunit IIC [Desulfitobacteriaceae bacterium]|nr:PTS transporter subunit IIC [Desulfitobacteriaceae bacterium]